MRAPTSALLASLVTLSAGGVHPMDGEETRPFTEPAPTHLLLQAHTPSSADARYLPVLLGAAPALSAAVAAGALPAYRQGGYYALAAHGGGHTWVAAERQGEGFRIVRRDLDGKILAAVALGEVPPAALHQVGDLVFVGQGNRVGTIDFAVEAPELEVARERTEMADKAYDLFVRWGDWLIAIDDVVAPIFADAFRLDDDGLTHVKGFELPGVINGTYGHAALRVDAEGNGRLYAVAPYQILDGYGHDLVALRFHGGASQADTSYALQNMRDPTTRVLEEHVSSRPEAGPARLVVGADYTPWRGLALLETDGAADRLLIAAEGRGLLVLPANFGRGSDAELHDLGGPCLDVRVVAGRVWALVGGDTPALLELAPRDLGERSRTPLPEVCTRIL